ncbi:predicted protein, partial [Nematostella vectensis]
DVKFIVGPNRKVVYANRCILAARCEVFRAMLGSDPDREGRQKSAEPDIPLVLADVSPEVFSSILEFLYTNTCTLNSNSVSVMDIMGSAMEYGLLQLQKICEQYIAETLAVNTASGAMQIAVTYNQEELQARCTEFIELNTPEVFKTKGFHELSEEALEILLLSDKLNIDELDLISSIREWATVNAVVGSTSVAETAAKVVRHIRLGLLTPEELRQIEIDNEKDNLIPVLMISEAWKFHALRKSPTLSAATIPPKPRAGTRPRDD